MRSWLLVLALAAPASAGPLRVENGHFLDDKGAVVILRGVNVAGDSKVPDFKPAEPKIFDPLPGWGMNVVRLLFTWEAYEPQAGHYDDTYFQYYRDAIRAAWAKGLYVVVDFHQDGFSRYLVSGCGEGFPEWAIPPDIMRAQPDNGPNCEKWGAMVLADDGVKATWEAFYADTYGSRTRFLYMLARVVTAFADEPGVIGYDLLNEPYGDEVTQIGPFYELAAPAVRAADPDAILFVSPTMLTSGGRQTLLTKPTFTNVAYAPHYYDPGLFLFHGWSGSEPDEVFGFMSGTAKSWGAAMFLGEFGAPPDADEQAAYLDSMYRHLDDVFASSAQWVYTPGWTPEKKDGWNTEDFSIVDDKGALRANFRARPYARRIAGTPLSMKTSGDEITLEWQNDPAKGATEIFAPTGSATGNGVECTREGQLVKCTGGAGKVSAKVGKEESRCGLTGAEALLIALLLSRRRSRGG